MTIFDDNIIGDANCHYPNGGEKGVTLWGPRAQDIYLAPSGQSGDSWTGYFTFTQPRCYQQLSAQGGTSVCNLTYTISITNSTTADDFDYIEFYLGNRTNVDGSGYPIADIYQGPRYHSKIQGHDITETHDISQAKDNYGNPLLPDTGAGWQKFSVKFVNKNPNVGAYIKGLSLIRVYQMGGIPTVLANPDECTCTQESGCSCRPAETFQQQSDFANRIDAPCNYDNCNNLSCTYWGFDNHIKKIDAGETVSWSWTNPSNSANNYVAKKSCLFNLNNTIINSSSTPSNIDDIQFSIKVNGSNWVDLYHTKKAGHHMAPSVDLANEPTLSAVNGYDDSPGARNTLYVKVQQNSANVGLALCDGITCDNPPTYVCCDGASPQTQNQNCGGGYVNIYRMYYTINLNQQYTISVAQTNGGAIYTTINGNVVLAPSTMSTYAYFSKTFTITPQAGYRITHVYVDGVDHGNLSSYTFSNVTANHSISATFTRQYHVTLIQAAEGVIAGPATVDAGSDPQYTVTAYCGSIAHIYLDQQDLGAHSSPYTFNPFPNISSDHTITAEYSTIPGVYAVGFDADHDTAGEMFTPEPCTFVVDGVSYAPDAGGSYGTACLTSGKHSFMAIPPYIHDAYNYHPLVHLEYGNNTYTCNPAVIDINSSNVVRALYTTIPDEPSYCTITVSAGANGTVYPNPENHTIQVLQGGCATFRVIPDSGYQVASATFNGQPVTVANNEFTAESISGNPTFAVTFQQQQQPPTQFSDDFNDNNMNTLYWQQVQAGSASCSESGQQLQVSATGGQNWSQAGYVTANSYNMVDKAATVTVANQSGVAEMELIVSPTKVTSSDPAGQPNWYRIIRNNSGTVQVQRYLNYNLANLSYSSASTPTTLSIAVQNGQIRFYNGGTQIYTESYQLATYDCYVYVITSSNVTGTGAFDNFSIAPIGQQFTITASAGSGGTINPSGAVTVNQGGNQTFTLTPNSGYHLSDLVRSDSGSVLTSVVNNQYTANNVTNNFSLTASFAINTYTITASVSSGGGSISPSGTVTVNHGSSPTFTLTPNTGYHLLDLVRSDIGSVKNSVVNNQYAANNVTNNFSLTATFSNQYKITATAGYGGSISPSGEVYVNQGSTPTFYITPDDYFEISSVNVNGYPVGQVTSYTFPSVQTDNQTISAIFEFNCQECYACYVFCQGCQDTCEINCETGCETSCQTGCEVSCQTGCEVACQTGCQVSCQTGCEVSCQSCNTCQTTCELSCQTGCQVTCQWGCEVTCQD
jgi:hypothetical protein